MTPATVPSSSPSRPSSAATIPVLYRLLRRGQLTRGRLTGLAALALIAVVFAVIARLSDDPEGGAIFAIADYGIGMLVPLAAVMVASPLFGNLIDDRLLVYLWLKPGARWHLAVAALAAAVAVLLPSVVVPLAAITLISGESAMLGSVLLAAMLGVVAYAALYLWLGLRYSWGLWLGLLYLVLWENTIARFGSGPARFSIRSYLLTVVEWGADREIDLADRADVAAVVVPVLVAVIALVLITRTLIVRDVD